MIDWRFVGAVALLALVPISFLYCAAAFAWGLFTGSVLTGELAERSWWRNKIVRKDENPLKYWYYMVVLGGLTALGIFIGVAVMLNW